MGIFVARQPVFTAKKKVFGYELLFRSSLANVFPDIDGNTATSTLLSNTFFSFGFHEILAEKVETHQEFEQAKSMGFGLFQGYFFAKSEMLSKKDISPGLLTKIKLINAAGQKEINLTAIETLIKQDLSVSFKLLKFINSAYFKRPTSINTIKDAMIFLGIDELKKFIHVVVISDLGKNKPDELIRSSVIRARMCEQCGQLLKTHFTTGELFTLGLFSLMDGRKIISRLPEFYKDAIQMADSFFG